ncbi:hypothetical protein ACQR1N_30160 [Bradyrhizobium sp. HKCCYLRH1073]|uniref:hypothetical protein n=1 Tax=unclassified Bradyrhizobium TaxID=2631580 RepID=UPI0028EE177E|nr:MULTISPECIES: hypothetical protein [unclassified Bradyrhizobium]
MYFIAFMIVVVLTAVVSLRRSMTLSRNARGAGPAQRLAARRRALWPVFCAAIFELGLIGLSHVQDNQELGPSATIHLMALTAAFIGGWFLGVIGGLDWD